MKLSPEEIDCIAEDPGYFFPPTKINRYKEFLDAERWNHIADGLLGRVKMSDNVK